MSYGVTSAGFRIKRLPEALSELQAALRAVFGPDINLEADSALGQLTGVLAQSEADIWELLASVYHSQYRAWAEGESLDAIGELVSLPRKEAETDAAYRRRLRLLPQRAEHSTADGVRNAVLAVPGVNFARVLTAEDTPPSDYVEYEAIPERRFEVVVDGGAAADIARAIWDHKPAGIQPYASPDGDPQTYTLVDPENEGGDPPRSVPIAFSRPKVQNIHVAIILQDPPHEGGFPSNWKDIIKANIVALGSTLAIGEDVVGQRFFEPIFTIPGLRRVFFEMYEIGNTENAWRSDSIGSPAEDGVVEVAPGARARFHASNIVIYVTAPIP